MPPVGDRLGPLMEAGEVAICSMVVLEVLFSARDLPGLKATRDELVTALDLIPTVEDDFQRAIEVMQLLASKGMHRAAPLPDLLIAAVSERADLVLLHYDADFDLISSVTNQRTEWIAPRGSL